MALVRSIQARLRHYLIMYSEIIYIELLSILVIKFDAGIIPNSLALDAIINGEKNER